MPEYSDFLLSLLTAAGLAGLVGLEREMRLQDKQDPYEVKLGGLRTFAMMGVIGFLGTWLAAQLHMPYFLPLVFIIAYGVAFSTHLMAVVNQKYYGITSSLSLLAGFLIGILVAINEHLAAITISILFTGLLALKTGLHQAVQKISKEDLIAILKFFILTSIILPMLPQSFIDPLGFFDWRPQTVWLMVMLVASIRFIGYFLAKFIDSDRSIFFSGIIGGLLSSTALTVAISQQSKESERVPIFVIPILLASALMFVRVLFEAFIGSGNKHELLSGLILPLGILAIGYVAGAGYLYYRLQQKKRSKNETIDEPVTQPITRRQPLKLASALSFGIFFIVIVLLSEKIELVLPQDQYNDVGLYLIGIVAGLTDVDAITLAMAKQTGEGVVSANTATIVILLAVLMNTLVKAGIVFLFGSRVLFTAVLKMVGVSVVVGAALVMV
jgi:uncharacterized membrane protein (DUF4010 family)